MEDEYMKRVRERLYKQVRETNWGAPEEYVSKPRGRKSQPKVIAEQKPRTAFEKAAMGKYNWVK
jgi:hypothetical protein